jgi:hypothetical protein
MLTSDKGTPSFNGCAGRGGGQAKKLYRVYLRSTNRPANVHKLVIRNLERLFVPGLPPQRRLGSPVEL